MEEKKLVLPTAIVPAETVNPRNLIIFSKPKIGKTEAIAQLPNCLIIDLEKGTKMVDSMKIEVDNINELFQVAKKIKEANYPYEYIAIDTITKLETYCLSYAEDLYSRTPMGSKWFTEGKAKYGSILALPNGGGYLYSRESFVKTINLIKTLAPNIILLGHIKESLINKNGDEFTAADLDLQGKLKSIIAADSDSIGYMYRKGNQNYISFKSSDEVLCGSRSAHLRNRDILISEMENYGTENEKLITYWENIYKPKK